MVKKKAKTAQNKSSNSGHLGDYTEIRRDVKVVNGYRDFF